MSIRKKHVVLVVDPEFGQKAKAHARAGPLWVIASPENRALIEGLWAAGETYDANSPTYFDAVPGRSPEDSAIAFVGTVHTHHPDWTTFEIVGVPLSAALVDELLECAAGSVVAESPTGFVFSRYEGQRGKTDEP